MSGKRINESPKHPIGVATSRTGIKPDVLRAWEKRYCAVAPTRSETGRRLYSDDDIARLRLLRRAVEAGRRIGDVAELPTSELEQLVGADSASIPKDSYLRRGSVAAALTDKCFEAIESLDSGALKAALIEAEVVLSRPQLRNEILVPLMERIGRSWSEGTLRIAHEHLATAVTKAFLAATAQESSAERTGPTLVIGTLSGQLHELGALLAAATAIDFGWWVVYLGPNLPAEEIAAAAAQTNASAVGLSLVYPSGHPGTAHQLARLRELLGPDMPILVGGRAARSYHETLRSIHATETPDLPLFQRALSHLAA